MKPIEAATLLANKLINIVLVIYYATKIQQISIQVNTCNHPLSRDKGLVALSHMLTPTLLIASFAVRFTPRLASLVLATVPSMFLSF